MDLLYCSPQAIFWISRGFRTWSPMSVLGGGGPAVQLPSGGNLNPKECWSCLCRRSLIRAGELAVLLPSGGCPYLVG